MARAARSVRMRIVGCVFVLITVAMTTTGLATYSVLGARLDERIDQQLAQEVQEFRAFARTGVDPRTGQEFTNLGRLLRVALRQNVPEANETLMTLINHRPYRRSAHQPPARLDTKPEIVAELARGQRAGFGTLTLPRGEVRYASVPVRVQGDPRQGRYVAAVFRWVEQRNVATAMSTFAWFGGGAILVTTLVAWLVAGQLLAPVRLLRRTAQQITETDLTRRIPVSGNDDVSELAQTFNAMLDRLEDAFKGQRQFLDDAGHELRTPITIVRGHVELMAATDATELAETRALVLDELDRMSRLVEELVTLAKARRPDFVRRESVDLASFTESVLDKAIALGQRSWRLDARADQWVRADVHRLTQAVVQLAQNAVDHTEPGDVVAVGSSIGEGTDGSAHGDVVRVWVRDTGVGVRPEDVERIFQRFARGAGETRNEGYGLGLAIVRAIAQAHGGRVVVDSRPGFGATFIIEIPRVPAESHQECPGVRDL